MTNTKNRIKKMIKFQLSVNKKIAFLFAIIIAAVFNSGWAQNTWVQKADFGGTPRGVAVGFSIGNKGYLGTGKDINNEPMKDFWEYDPAANAWTQKADFGGTVRIEAVGFNIGSKGYLGTGNSGYPDYIYYKDFWEYNPSANVWIQKADFGGTARAGAVGFSIGSRGYLGTGVFYNGTEYSYKDFWEYNPTENSWIQKADFKGTARFNAVGFSIGSKGYIGTGYSFGNYTKDFWEYDRVANAWVQKANFGGIARYGAVGFSIGNKGYLGTGFGGGDSYLKDFWEYDPLADTWGHKLDYSETGCILGVGFSIVNKGYLGTGIGTVLYYKDFWEYTPDNTCKLATNLIVTNISTSSATLKWDTVAGAEGYRLRYKPLHSGNWISKASSGVYEKVTGLLPGTAYRWEVKTYCHKDPPQVTSDGSAKGEFTTSTLSVSNEDVQKVSFQIYPVPAKDIVHIQTNVNASFSLVNQVGKILLTKNINGAGSINVVGIAAGLYYLKNNSTGAVQKIVIAR